MTVYKAYDHALRFLFSHPPMLISLLKFYLPEPWVKEIDFSTLQPLDTQHVTEALRTRASDLIWKLRVNSEWIYLIFMLEFQSTIDKLMALRAATYSGLILLDITKKEKRTQDLPPVFTLVLYTGESPWNAPMSLRDCFHEAIPTSLMTYQPDIKYKVLDIGSLPINDHSHFKEDLVSSFIRLEKATSISEVNPVIQELPSLLEGLDSLKRAYFAYIVKALKLPSKVPGVNLDKLEGVNMLSKMWERELQNSELLGQERGEKIGEQRGKKEGIREGKKEGKQESFKLIITKLLEKTHEQIPHNMKTKLEQSSLKELEQWLDQLLDEQLSTLS